MYCMRKVSHTGSSTVRPLRRSAAGRRITALEALRRGTRQLRKAEVFFGHGTDNPLDEAAALLLHVLAVESGVDDRLWRRRLTLQQRIAFEALLELRISLRCPAVYLTGRTQFAGLPLHTDSRALVPRSPIAELIERQFRPWLDPAAVREVLDLCTGGGCIALACAHYLPRARVVGSDISREALALARENARTLGLTRRVRFLESDHFAALPQRRYDIIVANPPYVGARELRSLPPEYLHEPRLALAAGSDGLDSVRVILREAAHYLTPRGLLVVEVGNTEGLVRRRWPRVPFTWLDFERGGGGVFLLTREQLQYHVR